MVFSWCLNGRNRGELEANSMSIAPLFEGEKNKILRDSINGEARTPGKSADPMPLDISCDTDAEFTHTFQAPQISEKCYPRHLDGVQGLALGVGCAVPLHPGLPKQLHPKFRRRRSYLSRQPADPFSGPPQPAATSKYVERGVSALLANLMLQICAPAPTRSHSPPSSC